MAATVSGVTSPCGGLEIAAIPAIKAAGADMAATQASNGMATAGIAAMRTRAKPKRRMTISCFSIRDVRAANVAVAETISEDYGCLVASASRGRAGFVACVARSTRLLLACESLQPYGPAAIAVTRIQRRFSEMRPVVL